MQGLRILNILVQGFIRIILRKMLSRYLPNAKYKTY